jgi:hypothetical protein
VLKSSENDNGNVSSMAFILVVRDYQISCQMTLKSFNKHLLKALKSYKDPFQQHPLDCNINKLLCSVIGAGGDFHGNVPY